MKFYLFDRSEKIIDFNNLDVLDNRLITKDGIKINMSENEVFIIQIGIVTDKDDVLYGIKSRTLP